MGTDDTWGTPEIPRDRWGRPLVVPPNGGKPVAYTRCTTYVGALEDRYNLGQWEMRMVALGLSRRPDLVLAASALGPDDRDELNKLCAQAKEAAASSASATIGTALHRLTERLDRGEPLGEVPGAYRPDIEAYRSVMAPLSVRHVERFCVLDVLRIGGTPDLVVEYDGRLYIADKKTGSIEYGALKMAMQLAVYAKSAFYDLHTDGTPMPRIPLEEMGVDQERAIIIHLPAGTGTASLKWVDIERGWNAVQTAKDVREWRSLKGLLYPFEPVDVFREAGFAVDPVDALPELIAAAPTAEALEALWRDNVAQWTAEHTTAAKRRKAEIHQRSLRDVAATAASA